jgi:prepilin signal peptidase PulO-like enzyme (type II secretory pathway)
MNLDGIFIIPSLFIWNAFLYWFGLWLVETSDSFKHHLSKLFFYIFCIFGSALFFFIYTFSPYSYLLSYFIFISALMVIIASDVAVMLISTFVTTALIPVGIFCALLDQLPITVTESIVGAITGYLFLWILGEFYFRTTGKCGIGGGDMDMLAMIGSFL